MAKSEAEKKAGAKYRHAHREEIRAKRRDKYKRDHEKELERGRQYRRDHPDKRHAAEAKSRAKHRDEEIARRKKYRDAHREELRAKYKEYLARNPEKRAESVKRYVKSVKGKRRGKRQKESRRYYDLHREQILAYQREYRRKNGGKLREYGTIYSRHRNARMKSIGGTHTTGDIKMLYEKQGHRCAACKAAITDKPGVKHFHVDHVMPIKLGGPNDISNLQLLCAKCNHRKCARHPDEWAAEHGSGSV